MHLLDGTSANVELAGIRERMRVRFYDPLTPHLAAGRIGHEKEFRLSCQTTIKGDLKVLTQPYNWFGKGTTEKLEKIGQRSEGYDALLKKKNPLQAKARALGITKPVKPDELEPAKNSSCGPAGARNKRGVGGGRRSAAHHQGSDCYHPALRRSRADPHPPHAAARARGPTRTICSR